MMQELLDKTIEIAQQGKGFTAPNPAVGAVIVKDGKIIAEGFHVSAGADHAEITAMKKLKAEQLDGATLYVSLEPCCHHGKTPPCTQAIINAKIKKVVYAHQDPNPLVAGKGAAELSAAGIACEHISIPEIEKFYQSYDYWQKTKMPFVTEKIAMSLDAKIALAGNKPIQITGEKVQQFVHQQRLFADAILTTAATIIADNPQMNVRLNDHAIAKKVFILDRQLQIDPNSKIFSTAKEVILLHGNEAAKNINKYKSHSHAKFHSFDCPASQLPLSEILSWIGQQGIHDLWVEAGGILFSNLLNSGIIQRAYISVAGKFLGHSAINAFHLPSGLKTPAKTVSWFTLGDDMVCQLDWV